MAKKKACCDCCRSGRLHKVKKFMARKVKVAEGVKLSPKKIAKKRKKPGSSNVGKYKDVSPKSFCGKAGGSSKYSYPVNTKKRARAALAYAHYAPNPSGIKKCVYRKFPEMGKAKKKK
jgi:hypothetical protein